MKQILATYHKHCTDGTTAAAVLLYKFPDAQVFPLGHGYTPEDIEPILSLITPETECFTLDCVLGSKEFLDAGCSVTTIDHHVSEKENLEERARNDERYTVVFDVEKSGASLAWSFFFPDTPEPMLVRYVEDMDLWNWRYGDDTKDVGNYLAIFHDDPHTVCALMKDDIAKIQEKGKIISLYADKKLEEQVKMTSLNIRMGEQVVPVYNITAYQSPAGNILSKKHDRAVGLFSIQGDRVKFSFRSLEHHVPSALELATSLGGGGHRNAAGAQTSLKHFIEMIVDPSSEEDAILT